MEEVSDAQEAALAVEEASVAVAALAAALVAAASVAAASVAVEPVEAGKFNKEAKSSLSSILKLKVEGRYDPNYFDLRRILIPVIYRKQSLPGDPYLSDF